MGQPKQVSIPNGMTTVYTYDTRNRLTKIAHKDGATVLDGWTYSLDDQGNITRTDQADVAGGSPASGAYRYYALDHLGSTSGLYDGAKAKVASLAYTPYGASYGDVGPGPLPRYTGHLWDGAAGLHLAPYRAYTPELARWLSRDPLGMVDGTNLYSYVRANPVNRRDPLGLIPQCPSTETSLKCDTGWCRDDTYSPRTHPGQTCYRSLSGIGGQQCCYDTNGILQGTSPDFISPASGRDGVDGSCQHRNPFIWAGHVVVDFALPLWWDRFTRYPPWRPPSGPYYFPPVGG